MEQSCYVASLKYSPVMWNHGRGLGEPVGQAGFPIRYLLASGYDWLCEDSELDVDLISLGGDSNPLLSLLSFFTSGAPRKLRDLFRAHPPSMLLFVNFNPLIDRIVVRIARGANPRARIVALFHEPHTEEKLVDGWKRALLLTAYEFLSKRIVRLSDAVILPSENARDTFHRFIPSFRGDSRVIPLVYVDVACGENLDRRFVSFVGQIGNAHQKGLDLFIEMVEENVRRSGDLAFQLVTGQSPQRLLESLSAEARASLKVVHAEQLTDEAISRAIRESLAVVLLQRRVMQSGALPMALMNGTPVLVSRLKGFTEFVEEGRTARILPVDSSLDQRFNAIGEIRENIDFMAPLCRRSYEEKFDSRCVAEHVPFLMGRPIEK
jgi:glycosyltransferase involved in cell wall biosynthesis